jgi:formylglycine-generating enzyme required for sulfatase activity
LPGPSGRYGDTADTADDDAEDVRPPRPRLKVALTLGSIAVAAVALVAVPSARKWKGSGPVVPPPVKPPDPPQPPVPEPEVFNGKKGDKGDPTGTGPAQLPRASAALDKSREAWKRQGFTPDPSSEQENGWPKVLLQESTGLRFVRSATGYYLPEKWTHSEKLAEDHWPEGLTSPEGLEFRRIGGGEFTMRFVPGEPRKVILTGFYMQATEVTNGQFQRWIDSRLPPFPDMKQLDDWRQKVERLERAMKLEEKERGGGAAEKPAQHPAVGVDHDTASSFARWAHAQLPTEAQWEYAARSRGLNVRFPWLKEGQKEPDGIVQANTRDLAPENRIDSFIQTYPVGRFPDDLTAQGLADMGGSVKEWCRDVWGAPPPPTDEPLRDPCNLTPPPRAEEKEYLIRGGSFFYPAKEGDYDIRSRVHKGSRSRNLEVGFRLVVECPAAVAGGGDQRASVR